MHAFTVSDRSARGLAGERLFTAVREVCDRLASEGWAELFDQHGLDIRKKNLERALLEPLPRIDRTQPGFEDFALEGARAIEPGCPARSLLFHALASPNVTSWRSDKGERTLERFPTLAEIEAVENYVYGVVPPSVDDLRARAKGAHLAIVVFAAEYRPAIGTVHRKHADFCYARTGIARVGTHRPNYIPAARGFLPFVPNDDHAVAALPCRYGAYIAALKPGDAEGHGPMRYIHTDPKASAAAAPREQEAGLREPPPALRVRVTDDRRNFWVPIHKLFDGPECIRGRTISVALRDSHRNEKIRRAHLRFLAAGHNAGWSEPDIGDPPFIFTEGIASFSANSAVDGSWLLAPEPNHLAAAAEYRGRPLTFRVPKSREGGPWRAYQSSLNLVSLPSGARAGPEYLHVRSVIEEGGGERDLNDEPNVVEKVSDGGYQARHFVDYTGDGWVDVECPELAIEVPRRLPAYSIVAAPDFFPLVDQVKVMAWTEQSVAPALLQRIWDNPNSGLPQALSDQRFAANLELPAGFDANDDTMTAIVGALGSGVARQASIDPPRSIRSSMLPDSAAGVFAPGWDVSFDRRGETDPTDLNVEVRPGTTFLTNYGLGSPFPEDSKLCAALSSFWPAAAPDVTRTFAPGRNYATATPLTDDVIGIDGSTPWDGVRGPVFDATHNVVKYTALAYGDWVKTAIANGFNLGVIGRTTAEDYVARCATMALVYLALGVTNFEEKLVWSVLSFRPAEESDTDLLEAQAKTNRTLLIPYTYRYFMYRHERGQTRPAPGEYDKLLVDVEETVLLFADPSMALRKDSTTGTWTDYVVKR